MSTFNNTKISVAITHDKKIYFPVVVGEITVEWVRFATPGKMTLTVYKDSALEFREGDIVTLKINGSQFFFGFVFTYERAGDKRYRLTCYDVLRYLKSSDVFKMKKMTYTKALKTACKRYGLKPGSIANTRYVRKGKVFTGSVYDMLEKYRKATKNATGDTYILYANWNEVTLRKQTSMKTNYVIDATLMKDFSYSSSIDDGVYTVVKLYRTKGKKTKVYSRTQKAAKKKYGRLTYAKSTNEKKKAKITKQLKKIGNAHDSPAKKLSFSGVFGIPSIRAGSGVKVKLSAVGMELNRNMTVDKVTHHFKDGVHTMDLTVVGGAYSA